MRLKQNPSFGFNLPKRLKELKNMAAAAKALDFERAIMMREEIKQLEELQLRL